MIGAAVALLGAMAACTPQPVTVEGQRVETLYLAFMAAAAVVFIIVAGLITWSIVRYRWRGSQSPPPQTRDNPRLEIAWWALPTLLVIGLFLLTAQVLGEVDEETSNPDLTITVTGFQWQWSFAYEDTDVVITGGPDDPAQLALPVGQRIAFDLVSPDVIHSFWVPEFLIKRDVVPGRTNRFEVTIVEEGTYQGQCGEFCGLLHDRMTFSILAMPADEFQAWLADEAASVQEAAP
jgi:cytochrome c oxidase subunit 2